MINPISIISAVQLITRDNYDGDDAGESDGPPSCVTAVPGPNGHVPVDACNSYYNFDPQFAPAVAVATLFGLLTGAHIVETFIFRKVRKTSHSDGFASFRICEANCYSDMLGF